MTIEYLHYIEVGQQKRDERKSQGTHPGIEKWLEIPARKSISHPFANQEKTALFRCPQEQKDTLKMEYMLPQELIGLSDKQNERFRFTIKANT